MWTTGTLVWMPIYALLMLIGVVIIAVSYVDQREDRKRERGRWDRPYDGDSYTLFRAAVVVVMLVITGLGVAGMYPLKTDYHQWKTKDGTVHEINKRLIGDGKGMQEKFVVVFAGSGQQYGCLDTRCALIEPGDYLKLACKKQFEYGATDGWDCKFRESREDGDA